MTKAAKKPTPMTEFTSHTLWTAKCSMAQDKKYDAKTTKQAQEQFAKAIAASHDALQKKLSTFEAVENSEAAALSVIR